MRKSVIVPFAVAQREELKLEVVALQTEARGSKEEIEELVGASLF